MNAYTRVISDRLDFLEFKQNVLLLKNPQHKVSIFWELPLDYFILIRDFTISVEECLSNGEVYTINDYEKELYKIWPPVKSYPSASTLVAKALMEKDNFDCLFSHDN